MKVLVCVKLPQILIRGKITGSCTITSSAEYNKYVILLPSPTPRGKDKAELQKLGLYVDAVRFSKVKSEDEVKSKI